MSDDVWHYKAEIERRNARITELEDVIGGFVNHETDPCVYDHHGYCQEHGWFDDEKGCMVAYGKRVLEINK